MRNYILLEDTEDKVILDMFGDRHKLLDAFLTALDADEDFRILCEMAVFSNLK